MRKLIALIAVCLLAGCSKPTATVETPADTGADWPAKPVKVTVPFSPGGSSDQMVRVIQKAIQDDNLMSQRLTVINVSGHYSVGCRKALEAKPDGYNFLVVHQGLMGGQASGLIDFGHANFDPVAETASLSVVLTVREDSPWQSMEELLAAAAEKPDSIIFGVNLGALNHMAGAMIEGLHEGAAFRFVQIGGGSENFTALAGGHTQATVFSTAEYLSFRSKGLRGLAFTGETRHEQIPDIATLKEKGHDVSFEISSWWFAPKGTPQAAIDGLVAALGKAVETDYVKEQYASKAITPKLVAGADFASKLDTEWAQVEAIAGKLAKKAE